MPKRELTDIERELLKKISQAVTARSDDLTKAAFDEFKVLCGSALASSEECPMALYGVENTFVSMGLYMGDYPIPDVVNFDNALMGHGAAAHEG